MKQTTFQGWQENENELGQKVCIGMSSGKRNIYSFVVTHSIQKIFIKFSGLRSTVATTTAT